MADIIIIAVLVLLCTASGILLIRKKGKCSSCYKNCSFCKKRDS